MTPFTHAKRGSMTPQRRARIFAAHDGRCHKCTRKLGPADGWEVDHIIALSAGGTDDDANLAPCCDWCHDEKSDDDTSAAGKGRRRYSKHVVPKRFQRSRAWR
jgi:5-methylcytosine-specific restriction protein A